MATAAAERRSPRTRPGDLQHQRASGRPDGSGGQRAARERGEGRAAEEEPVRVPDLPVLRPAAPPPPSRPPRRPSRAPDQLRSSLPATSSSHSASFLDNRPAASSPPGCIHRITDSSPTAAGAPSARRPSALPGRASWRYRSLQRSVGGRCRRGCGVQVECSPSRWSGSTLRGGRRAARGASGGPRRAARWPRGGPGRSSIAIGSVAGGSDSRIAAPVVGLRRASRRVTEGRPSQPRHVGADDQCDLRSALGDRVEGGRETGQRAAMRRRSRAIVIRPSRSRGIGGMPASARGRGRCHRPPVRRVPAAWWTSGRPSKVVVTLSLPKRLEAPPARIDPDGSRQGRRRSPPRVAHPLERLRGP